MFKKFLLLLIITLTICCAPVCASEIDNLEEDMDSLDQYLTLKKSQSESILKHSSTVLLEEWRKNVGNGNWTEEIDPLPLVELFITKQTLEFFVLEYPGEIVYNIGKEMFSLARMVSIGDASGLIGKIEEVSVNKAIEYATNELFEREARVGFGAIIMNYQTNKGEQTSAQINYIIIQKQINGNNGEERYDTVIRFYSPKSIKVHNGVVYGRQGIEFISKDNIAPFTITIKGEMNSTPSWIGTPEINIEYPETVPDFGFKKVSFLERKIVEPVKDLLKTINKIFGFLGGSIFDSFSANNLEKIENNENLKGISEEIKVLEQEIEADNEVEGNDSLQQVEQEFSERISQLNEENKGSKETEPEGLILKENMNEEEIRTLLIAIYNELKKRKEAADELKKEEEFKEEESKKEEEKEDPEEEIEEIEPEAISYCSYNNQNPLRNSLIINEVAWMGTNTSSSDEWIEIKNISNQEISLKGYQLFDKENQIQVVFEDLKLASGGYILLERTDDNTIPNIKADVIYKGGLNNTKESLYLFNNNCLLQDIVEANPNWPGGDSSNKKSMERKSDLTWQTYSGDSFGTPRAQNSESKNIIILSSGGGGGGGGESSPEEEDEEEEPVITYCSQEGLGKSLKTPIIINEVAWMGTDVSSSDEWIELKNITSEDVSLKGWQILDNENKIRIVFEEGDKILANSFYLLERTDDSSVPSILADKIYSGALTNTEESLRIFNSNCQLVDQVLANPNWPAGETGKSMERKSDLTWQTYLGDSFGTPRAENSIKTEPVLTEASTYCIANGGIIENRIKLDGDYNVCVFEHGKECEEVSMYEKKCPLYGVDISSYLNSKEIYCAIKGGEVDSMEVNNCNFSNGKSCDLDDFFTGSCSDNAYATSLVISEVNDGYDKGEREYVRIYNQSGEDVPLCSETSCNYLAYFWGDLEHHAKWNEPNLNIPLPSVLISNNSTYQIDFNKNNRGDYAPILDPPAREDGYFETRNASICIFNQNVESLTEQEAEESKIDCVGWNIDPEVFHSSVKEGTELHGSVSLASKAIFRKQDTLSNKYFDRDNNYIDFERKEPTIYTIPAVSNFIFTELEDETKLKLSWDFDDSLDLSKLSYKIYYTENSAFNESDLKQISEQDTVITGTHIETVVPIEKDIDYRFRVDMFEDGGNVSDSKESLFYVSFSSFDPHLYGLFRYDSNKTNKVNYLGPQGDMSVNNLIESELYFYQTPLIDKYGNFYVTRESDNPSFNYRIVSYDKNGLLRWNYYLKIGAHGEMILKDALYYFAENDLIKISFTGQEVWRKSIYRAIDFEKYLYYNDNLYFYCIRGDKKGVCKTDLDPQEGSETTVTLIYEMKVDDISNFVVDSSGNVFFVDNGSKLVKISPSLVSQQINTGSTGRSLLNIVNDKILISFANKEILVNAATMNIITLKNGERVANFHNVSVASNGFYLFEATSPSSRSSISFLGVDSDEIKLFFENVSRLNSSDCPPVVDINDNFYYSDINENIVGYKIVGGAIVKILDKNIGTILDKDLILLNGKIYFTTLKKLVEVLFE